MNEERDERGRFIEKNRAGRKPGVLNSTTVDSRALRERIVQSWDRCDGDKLLERIAETDPLSYVRLVVALLPHDERFAATNIMKIVVNTGSQLMFAKQVMQLAGDEPVKPDIILKALEAMPDGQASRDNGTGGTTDEMPDGPVRDKPGDGLD